MRRFDKVMALALAFCLVSSTAVFACHSNYFKEIFTKVDKAGLDKASIAALYKLKNNFIATDHQNGRCDQAHDSHQAEFVAAAAGILNDSQFQTVLGKPKTEVQKLRFEVNELKKEVAELKALIQAMKK